MLLDALRKLWTENRKPKTENPEECRVLFILKERGSGTYSYGQFSGLFLSAQFITIMLSKLGIPSKIVEVVDNNSIDREVAQYQPTHCIIEALWVVPEKFAVLSKLHPGVKWIIRIHSNLPFLAVEGMAARWIFRYLNYNNVSISFNSMKAFDDFSNLLACKYGTAAIYGRILYQPNWYDMGALPARDLDRFAIYSELPNQHPQYLDIGCFGAIRPLKNQLIQAAAAIIFARLQGRYLRFHINADRCEGYSANSILQNLRYLFAGLPACALIEHPWLEHDDFLSLVECMDLGMQLSFSETFNIVCADFVNSRIPLVVSSEINWLDKENFANPNSTRDIVSKMLKVFNNGALIEKNYGNLQAFCAAAEKLWPATLK